MQTRVKRPGWLEADQLLPAPASSSHSSVIHMHYSHRPGSEVYIEAKQDMRVFSHVVSLFAVLQKIGKRNHFKFAKRVRELKQESPALQREGTIADSSL